MPLLSFNQYKNNGDTRREDLVSRADTQVSTRTDGDGDNEESTEKVNVAESRAKALLRDEFLINMQKFASSINRTIQQIEGEVRLDIPEELEISDNVEEVFTVNFLLKKQIAITV